MSEDVKDVISEHQQLVADYKAAFKSDAGVNVLRDLSRFCLEHKMTADINNVNLTFMNEGQRRVIRYIREKIADTGEPRQSTVSTERNE